MDVFRCDRLAVAGTTLVLSDFGAAGRPPIEGEVTTFEYRAPEAHAGQGTGKAADIWAWAVVARELATGSQSVRTLVVWDLGPLLSEHLGEVVVGTWAPRGLPRVAARPPRIDLKGPTHCRAFGCPFAGAIPRGPSEGLWGPPCGTAVGGLTRCALSRCMIVR